MDSIRKLLKPPTFKFTGTDWLQFLNIHEFGSMKRIRRDTGQSLPAIRKAFLYLSDNSISLATRIDETVLVGGKYHVPGIGLNIATKVLAMLNPETMGVFNKAVRDTLRSFGYKIDAKKSLGEQYAEFCREMLSFVNNWSVRIAEYRRILRLLLPWPMKSSIGTVRGWSTERRTL